MLTRIITGSIYLIVLAGFYLLKIFVDDIFFDGLIYLFSLVGTYEILHAFKEKTTASERVFVYVFSLICIPVCGLYERGASRFHLPGGQGIQAVGVCFFILCIALLMLLVVRHEETTPENISVSLFSAVYPTILLSLIVVCNHFTGIRAPEDFHFDSRLAILAIFVISPFADTFAYLFGRLLHGKFPKKLAPDISPNKTVVGGIGGVVGGIIGAIVLYFTYNNVNGSYQSMDKYLAVYIAIGILVAVADEIGDLVESAVKRKLGIKDMGKIMPGHGGVLDRIDGTLFSAIIVYLAFMVAYTFL